MPRVHARGLVLASRCHVCIYFEQGTEKKANVKKRMRSLHDTGPISAWLRVAQTVELARRIVFEI